MFVLAINDAPSFLFFLRKGNDKLFNQFLFETMKARVVANETIKFINFIVQILCQGGQKPRHWYLKQNCLLGGKNIISVLRTKTSLLNPNELNFLKIILSILLSQS